MSLPMLAAKRVGLKAVLTQTSRTLSLTPQRGAGYWNKDWRPTDKPPHTEEERRAAAKKYGLIPEDYKPYPDDGDGYGDYPELPLVSAEARDPHGVYDFPELKRNFGEPMHIDFDMVGEDRWHYNQKFVVPLKTQMAMLFGVLGGGFLMTCIGEYIRVIPCPKMPRQFPKDGQTHYSFELEDVE